MANASPMKAIQVDVADYFNVFVKHDVPPGTLLVVSKAFATCFSEEVKNINFQVYFQDQKHQSHFLSTAHFLCYA
jgi:hypothetical protein